MLVLSTMLVGKLNAQPALPMPVAKNDCNTCLENGVVKQWSDSIYCENLTFGGTYNPTNGFVPCVYKVCVNIRNCNGRYEVKISGIESSPACADQNASEAMTLITSVMFYQNKFALYDSLLLAGQNRQVRIQRQSCWKRLTIDGRVIYFPCRDQPCCITDMKQVGHTGPQCTRNSDMVFYDVREYDMGAACALADTMGIDSAILVRYNIPPEQLSLIQSQYLSVVDCQYVCRITNPTHEIELVNGTPRRVPTPYKR